MIPRFSTMTRHLNSSTVRDILKLTQGRDILSLAGGLPAEDFFPVAAIREAYERALQSGGAALQYGLTEGFVPLRERLCEQMAANNCHVHPDEILLTTGSQQSIDLMARIFLDPEDAILVEAPTYLSALQVFQSYRGVPVAVETDEHGMLPDDLEVKLLRYRPKFIYVIPTFSNPGGNVWNMERREAVVELCRKHEVLIFEDDPYGKLKFNADIHFPSLYSIDQQYGGAGNVVYTSTFSKTVAPGVRTGWMMADASIVRMAATTKQASDLHSSVIDQRALYELLGFFDWQNHIRTVSTEYYARMVTMISLMKDCQWEGTSWVQPQGGMFIWIQLPEHIRADVLLQHAVREGVAFVPGQVFYSNGAGYDRMRVNFTHTNPHLLPEAIQRIDRAFRSYDAASVSV